MGGRQNCTGTEYVVLAPGRVGLGVCALALAALGLAIAPAQAQYKVKVQVDTSKPMGMMYPTSLGIAADHYDGQAFSPASIQLLEDAGITNMLYPGNKGIDAVYHWSTGTLTNPYSGDKNPFGWPPEKQFSKVLPALVDLGTGLVTVNYGSNLNGTGGGEPAEAAAWVAYANGVAQNPQVIGKDSKGNDWKTVGYWASLRGASPLATDDGYNLLRIGHSQPFGIQLWAIGNDPQDNGYYGGDHAGEPDLHLGQVATAKDWMKHAGKQGNGPSTYGNAVVAYVKAMKAVDPSIMVGATLTSVPPDAYLKNWNAEVLKAACGSMDFATVSLMSGSALSIDWKTLDEDDLLKKALGRDFSMLTSELADKTKKNCPSGRFPPLAITSFGVNPWMPVKHPIAVGLYVANATASLIESGVYTVMSSPEHSAFMLDDKTNAPRPVYYGIKMIHEMATPGDVFVATTNSMPDAIGVHAVKRRDGGLGLLLVSKELGQASKVTVSIPNYHFAAKGTRYEWSQSALDAGKGVAEAPIDNLSGTFTVDVPPSGIVSVVIPKAE